MDSPEHGGLADEAPSFSNRWEHVIDAQKHPKARLPPLQHGNTEEPTGPVSACRQFSLSFRLPPFSLAVSIAV